MLRDCRKITYVTLNGFCTCPFLYIHLIKIGKIDQPDLLFLVVFITFYISRYIIFHKYLELHATLSVKEIFVTNFPF